MDSFEDNIVDCYKIASFSLANCYHQLTPFGLSGNTLKTSVPMLYSESDYLFTKFKVGIKATVKPPIQGVVLVLRAALLNLSKG